MIEVDPSLLTDPDNDYYSSDNDTSTESITSSIQQYIYENGRRYHAYYGTEKWHMPTDEVEQESSTAPGGYVELCETSIGTVHCDDGTMKPDHSVVIFGHHLRDALTKIGRPQPDHQFMANVLIQAGYEDVKMLSAKEPIEPWPKDPQLKKRRRYEFA
ncbi:Similar to hypothetical protein CH063_03417, partial [Colletotrichum higginsianum]; acc. no. CCF44741 [Pyronema omphalodes CBS 100304]|uniref:Uncharacterized protein n=1 Tax=Pyronema omphalodes (strain CBS 100304) TaxID=1076935 RepID=U4KUF9_PYROM